MNKYSNVLTLSKLKVTEENLAHVMQSDILNSDNILDTDGMRGIFHPAE